MRVGEEEIIEEEESVNVIKYHYENKEIGIIKQTEFSDGYAVGVSDEGEVFVIDEAGHVKRVSEVGIGSSGPNTNTEPLSIKTRDVLCAPSSIYLEKFDNGIAIAAIPYKDDGGWTHVSCFNKDGRELGYFYKPCQIKENYTLKDFISDNRNEIYSRTYVKLARNMYEYGLNPDTIDYNYSKLLIDIKSGELPQPYIIAGLREVVEHIFEIDVKRHEESNCSKKDLVYMKKCQQMVLKYYADMYNAAEDRYTRLEKRDKRKLRIRYVIKDGGLRPLLKGGVHYDSSFDIIRHSSSDEFIDKAMGINEYDTPRRQKRTIKKLKYNKKQAQYVSKVLGMVSKNESQDLQPEIE